MRNGDGPAEGGAELVALEIVAGNSLFTIEVGVGVEVGVADEVKTAAVILVGAGFGDDADDAGAVAAIFSGVVAGEDAELLDGVGIGIEDDVIAHEVVIDAAVEEEGDGVGAAAADVEVAGAAIVGVILADAGLEKSEVEDVATVQGHVDDGAAGDGRADGGIDGFDVGADASDLDGFGFCADGEAKIHARFLVDLEGACFCDELGETVMLGGDDVGADGERGDAIVAFAVGLSFVNDLSGRAGNRDVSLGDGGALRVGDPAENGSGGGLGPGGGLEKRDRKNEKQHNTQRTHGEVLL